MQKRIFMQKNQKGSRSYAKLLLLAAVGLIILVVVAPLFTRHKDDREVKKRPGSEKGMVVKEIPRSLELMKENSPLSEGLTGDESKSAASGPAPDLVQQSPSGTVGEQPTAPPAEKNTTDELERLQKAQPWVEMPKKEYTEAPVPGEPGLPKSAEGNRQVAAEGNTAPKEGTSVPMQGKDPFLASTSATEPKELPVVEPPPPAKTPAAAPSTRTAATASRDASVTGGQKPAPKSGGISYTVQVGSFKDKQNAEEMQQNLKKKGYQAVMKTSPHPKLGQLYVVQLAPVNDVRKASTLVEQIKHEEKVKPMIVKVPQGE